MWMSYTGTSVGQIFLMISWTVCECSVSFLLVFSVEITVVVAEYFLVTYSRGQSGLLTVVQDTDTE